VTVAKETYNEQMNVYLGERRIRVMNFGRAVTPGDTVCTCQRKDRFDWRLVVNR